MTKPEDEHRYWENPEWLAINAKLGRGAAFLPFNHLNPQDLHRIKELMRPYWDAMVARLVEEDNPKQIAELEKRGIPQWFHEK